jgi:hypothetical protein
MRKRQRLRQHPTIADMFKTFRHIDAALSKLADGWVFAEGETPVFQFDTGGEWLEFVPAIRGWAGAFERLLDRYKDGIDLSPLRNLADALERGETIPTEQAIACQSIVNACKKAYRRMDVHEIYSIAKTARIAIYMEDQQRSSAA